jgi:hypothetical protein
VTALKDIRAELGQLLETALGVVSIPVGENLKPPCVVVAPADPYTEPVTYCADGINLEVFVAVGPGQDSARIDALDDLLDLVRDALRVASPGGLRFAYQGIDRPTFGQAEFLGASVRVRYEREDF